MVRSLLCTLAFLLPAYAFAQTPEFEKDIVPLLTNQCLNCHGGLVHKHNLDLRTIESMLQGGKSGPAIVAKDPEKSLMWHKIASDEMPKTLIKLTADDKRMIKDWIAAGMPRSKQPHQFAIAKSTSAGDPRRAAEAIDRSIEAILSTSKTPIAPLADDAEFHRRLCLDLTGHLPSPERVRAFLASTDPAKRTKLIDDLLERPEYDSAAARRWHNLLMPLTDGKRSYNEEVLAALAKSFNANRPWDEIVTGFVAAEGDAEANPGVHYLLAHKDPEKISQRSASLFLGLDLECAECHNHPHALWKQKDDFWALAAFFGQLRTSKKGTVLILADNASAGKTPPKIKIPTTALVGANAAVPAGFPGQGEASNIKAPYRKSLADWMTAPENPYFAAAAVNRAWAHCFGRGLVNPIDNFHEGNAPTHPEAMAILIAEFKASKYDLKHLYRCICSTRAYQRTSRTDAELPDQEAKYGRMPLRVLDPELLYDAFCFALDVDELNVPGFDPKAKKRDARSPAPRDLFVNTFPQGDEPKSTEYSHGVLQILQFVNWKDFNAGGLIVPKLLAAKTPPEELIETLYLRTLSRRPSAQETARLSAYIQRQQTPEAAYASVLWMLINSNEFAFNH